MLTRFARLFLFAFCFIGASLPAQVPQIINFQGRVNVNGAPFAGPTGSFKFALVNGNATATFWSNDGTSTAGSQPTAAVSLPVSSGLYSVLLGDTSIGGGMTQPIATSVFTNSDVRLRVWFNNGVIGFQLLTPDQRITAVGYALVAQQANTVAAGAVTSGSIANGAVGSVQLASSLTISGTMTAGSFSGPGTVPWQAVVGTAQSAQANKGYIANDAAQVTITLPASPNVGDVVAVSGAGPGGWMVVQNNANQSIVGYGIGATWTPRQSNRSWYSVASSADGTKLVAVHYGGQIYTSTDSGATWTARESSRGWQSVASSADGTKLVAAGGGQMIYTSTDSGVTWTPRESIRQWYSVASSADGTKLVAVDGGGGGPGGQIYTSTDSGVTWTPRESNRLWTSVTSSTDGTKLVAVPYNGQIYTSTDSGVSWTARESSRQWWSVASSADGTKLIAAVYNGQIYTSNDSGLNWIAHESSRYWHSVASSADGTKLVGVVDGGQIYTSNDSGVDWTPRESNRSWISVASSADGTKLVAVEYGGKIYTSVISYLTGGQGAATELQYAGNGQWLPLAPWTVAAGGVTSGSIANGAVGSAQLASSLTIGGTLTAGNFSGNGAGLNSVPGTVPWQAVAGTAQAAQANQGYIANDPAQVTVALPASPNVGDVVGVSGAGLGGWKVTQNANQSIIGYDGTGVTWTPRESNRDWTSVASSVDGTKLVAVVWPGQIYTSTDSGVTWTPRESSRNWESVASSADGTKLVAVDHGGQIYTSTDSGATWTPRESNRNWWSVVSSADGSKLVAVVFGGQIYTSSDSGVTWTPRETNREWTSVASSADGTKLVAVDFRGQIYTSINSGTTWTSRETNRNWDSVASSADGTKLVAVAQFDQIYISIDSGATWTPRENNRPWHSVASSADGTRLVAVDYGGGTGLAGQIYTSSDSGVTWTPRESNRIWLSVASSADGTKLVAVDLGGRIYTSGGSYPTGDQATAAQLQYVGNGQWLPLDPWAAPTFTGNVTIASPGTLNFGSTTRQMLNLWDSAYGAGVQSDTLYFRSGGNYAWYRDGAHNDGTFNSGGGTELMRLGYQGNLHLGGPYNELSLANRDTGGFTEYPTAGERWVLYSHNQGGSGRLFFWSGGDKASIDTSGNLYTAGALNPPSDRNVKANFAAVNAREVLAKITALPIRTWNYTNDPLSRHIGPVSQDFHAAFGFGADDKHIATVDADGVALAAIQGLNQKLEERLQQKDAELKQLQERIAKLEGILTPLTRPSRGGER